MKSLYSLILEGGAGGHMKHPYDYIDFTLRNLKGLIRKLFEGKIEDITEKVDGMNIQATRNTAGEVVFIRNKGDLNNARGGMTLEDMINKWSDKPHVLETFTQAAETIIQVFSQVPTSFFNKEGERHYVNCECVVAGKTNIMYYVSNQVDFHDIWIYKFNGKEWEKTDTTKEGLDKLQKAAAGSSAQITPQIIIDTEKASKELMVTYIKELDKIWKLAQQGEYNTVDEWKRARFVQYCEDNDYKWILENEQGKDLLFNRWFNADKSTNIKIIRELYKNHSNELESAEKSGFKKIVSECMEPLDDFFIRLGNDIIKLCKGIINDNQQSAVVRQLAADLKDTVDAVRKEGSVETNEKLDKQLKRLGQLGEDNLSAVEGIVFKYNDKVMKLTGSFAPLNQILGLNRFSR